MERYQLSQSVVALLVFLQLCIFNTLTAQLSLSANKLDYRSGFTCGQANTILEDPYGFVWIGCYNGLFRFDRSISRAFISQPGDSNSLAMNSVTNGMLSRTYKEIILFLSRGISTLHVETYQIQNHLDTFDSKYAGLKFVNPHQVNDTTVLCVVFDDFGFLQFVKLSRTGKGLNIEPFIQIQSDPEYTINTFRRFHFLPLVDGAGQYYLFADRYVFLCDLQDMSMRLHYTFDLLPGDKGFENQIVVAEKLNDHIFLVSIEAYGLIEYDPVTNLLKDFKRVDHEKNNFYTLYKDHSQTIWIGTSEGDIYIYNPYSDLLETVTLVGFDLRGTYIKNFNRISKDKVYISTSSGVFEVNLGDNFFRKLSLQNWFVQKTTFVQNAYVHPVLPLIYVDDATQQYVYVASITEKQVNKTNIPSSSFTRANSFYYYGKDKLVCLHEGDIYMSQSDPASFLKWTHQRLLDTLKIASHKIESMVADKSGHMLVSYHEGLKVLHPGGKISSMHLNHEDSRWRKIKWAAFEKDYCYLIFDSEVYIWDFDRAEISKIVDQTNNPLLKKWTTIFKIESKLILSSINGGISIWDLNCNKWESYNPANNYTNEFTNVVHHASMDKDSIIWYSTDKGLVRYDFRHSSFTWYTFGLNLANIQVHRPLVSNSEGLYCIGHQLEVDYTENMFQLQKSASTVLEINSLKINGKELVKGALFRDGYLSLHHSENNIELNWYFSDHTGMSYYTCRYRLLGLQDEFQYGRSIQTLKYLKIPPGKYKLQIEYVFDPTNEVIASKTIEIIIRYAWYQTWWFYLLMLLLVGGIVLFLVYQKINSVRRKAALQADYERELSDMRLATLRMQMNPHFMFNALNSIKNYILKNESSLASKYLSQFALLFRSILQFSMEKYISLKDELNALKLYIELEQLRIPGGFEFTISIDESIDIEEVRIQPLLLQPFVENAIWHGLSHKNGDKRFEIIIKYQDELLLVSIVDNGIGQVQSELIRKNKLGKESHGIKITNARLKSAFSESKVEIIDIYNEDGSSAGTKVNLTLPYIS